MTPALCGFATRRSGFRLRRAFAIAVALLTFESLLATIGVARFLGVDERLPRIAVRASGTPVASPAGRFSFRARS
jgi:hypothetical protein